MGIRIGYEREEDLEVLKKLGLGDLIFTKTTREFPSFHNALSLPRLNKFERYNIK